MILKNLLGLENSIYFQYLQLMIFASVIQNFNF